MQLRDFHDIVCSYTARVTPISTPMQACPATAPRHTGTVVDHRNGRDKLRLARFKRKLREQRRRARDAKLTDAGKSHIHRGPPWDGHLKEPVSRECKRFPTM